MVKDDGAFLTIGELAQDLGIAQHILRYWETRFSQLRPLQRSGNRRYYRPRDVDIARQINRLLNEEGFTVRGAQRVLAGGRDAVAEEPEASPNLTPIERDASGIAPHRSQGELPIGEGPSVASSTASVRPPAQVAPSDLALLIARLTVIRQNLVEAIDPT
jgi:DNA-binding transcriptional MerR regulator